MLVLSHGWHNNTQIAPFLSRVGRCLYKTVPIRWVFSTVMFQKHRMFSGWSIKERLRNLCPNSCRLKNETADPIASISIKFWTAVATVWKVSWTEKRLKPPWKWSVQRTLSQEKRQTWSRIHCSTSLQHTKNWSSTNTLLRIFNINKIEVLEMDTDSQYLAADEMELE